MSKKRPQDLTVRNARASLSRDKALRVRIRDLEKIVMRLRKRVCKLEKGLR